jgi:transposase-like protein
VETITITSLSRRITCEADAYGYMERLRWPNGPVCPHCGHDKAYFLKPRTGLDSRPTRTGAPSQRRVWKCAKCRKQFSVTTGTIFHGSKVSLQTWLFVFFEMCANKNGLAAREVERKYGVSPKTAWFITHRIREAMRNKAPDALVGTIVADETWIGGDPQRMNRKTRARWEGQCKPEPIVPGSRPHQGTAKTPVFSLIDAETGEVRSRVMTDVTGASLRKAMAEQVNIAASVLHSDEGGAYRTFGHEFIAHHTVNHDAGRYFDYGTGASTNKAENYFSQLKRSIDGTHHSLSRRHLQRYLWEFDFRYSTHKMTDTQAHHAAHGPGGRPEAHLQAGQAGIAAGPQVAARSATAGQRGRTITGFGQRPDQPVSHSRTGHRTR